MEKLQQEEKPEVRKRKNRRKGARLRNVEECKEELGSRERILKLGLNAADDMDGGGKNENGFRKVMPRGAIDKTVVKRREGGEVGDWKDLESGDGGSQDGEKGVRREVRRKQEGERKLRIRRKKMGDEKEEKKKTVKMCNRKPDEDVRKGVQLLGGGRTKKWESEDKGKEAKAEIDRNESKDERDPKKLTEGEKEGETGREVDFNKPTMEKKKTSSEDKGWKRGEEKGRIVDLAQPAVEQLLAGKRLPQKATALLPCIHRASKV